MTSPSNRLLRLSEVAKLLGVSTSTLYKWVKLGQFPRPIMLGPMNPKQRQTKRWVLSEVEQWVNERAREDDYE